MNMITLNIDFQSNFSFYLSLILVFYDNFYLLFYFSSHIHLKINYDFKCPYNVGSLYFITLQDYQCNAEPS